MIYILLEDILKYVFNSYAVIYCLLLALALPIYIGM